MTDKLSHLDDKGAAHMVDVGEKAVTSRSATASARIIMKSETRQLILDGKMPKGDVFATARLAGIMAAKKTPDLIPLCHPLMISKASVEFTPVGDSEILVEATVKVSGQTGVEMEALSAVSVAALTLYDMCKAAEKGIQISDIKLVEKTGGKSGTWTAGED